VKALFLLATIKLVGIQALQSVNAYSQARQNSPGLFFA